jgi:hypothetical protein
LAKIEKKGLATIPEIFIFAAGRELSIRGGPSQEK